MSRVGSFRRGRVDGVTPKEGSAIAADGGPSRPAGLFSAESGQSPGVAKTKRAMKATLMKKVASTRLTVMKNGV